MQAFEYLTLWYTTNANLYGDGSPPREEVYWVRRPGSKESVRLEGRGHLGALGAEGWELVARSVDSHFLIPAFKTPDRNGWATSNPQTITWTFKRPCA